MMIRGYTQQDCITLAELFWETVHTVNAKDYTKEQLDVWASGEVDFDEWNRSFLCHTTAVAEEDGKIIGFGDMDETGYLDRLYVHKDFQRKGVASAICSWLEEAVPAGRYTTYASVTARPFFEKRGFVIVQENQAVRSGVSLLNYYMEYTRYKEKE
ncbi:MAG: GNAT family N-acetyltransferase [Emergencia sp.]